VPDPADRRARLVRLTARADRVVHAANAELERAVAVRSATPALAERRDTHSLKCRHPQKRKGSHTTASDCLSPLQLKRLIAVLGRVHCVPIKLENVGIAVRDLEATIAFFNDLGLTVLGRDTVSGEWTDTAVGLDGNHAKIAMLQTPDGNGRLELFEYIHPDAIETEPTQPNQIGMHRVAFSVDDIDEALEIAARHGCHPLRGVATYEDMYKLTYVRGPSDIIVMLAEELSNS
jgi:glyoxylase I family protein